MIFGIDYHGTFQRDIDLFRDFVKLAQGLGHTCVLVTGIADQGHYAAELRRDVGRLMPIVFADGAWKNEAAKAAGFEVDVWIDDRPDGIRKQEPGVIATRDGHTTRIKGQR